ncbi:MAG: DUF2341 domain-containing protein [Candidatus Marinimicrobia bacterium]|jgi:hypothetical protein|nr:DUF2341 domain-containing protein [Candidatus Neomarinimicrobiota bacterium]MBT4946981.1 DUF2341 domain-containing protein [Candidatus Neomarinimicrobiota bacterium]MBT5268390.1 DUF2341 domain-containing protein [Candidatus Neomarinimicrobiota bacterium]MBT6011181.1 DUF2341 domain-containing protein [Candidatus Neomarinimicrobiota bacterium]
MLLVILVFTSDLSAQPAGYGHRKLITLNSSQISGSTAHTNFPVMVEFTDVKLKSLANGGGVVNPSGFDIIFTEADGSTLLDQELQNYDPATGHVLSWVRLPVLSPTVDTDIYLYYGNDAIFTNQSTTSTWNANYLSVWHLEDLNDSSPNGHTLLNNLTVVNPAGVLGAAREFDGDGDYLEDQNGAIYLDQLADITVSIWAKPDAIDTDRGLYIAKTPAGNDNKLSLRADAAGSIGGAGINRWRTTIRASDGNQKHNSSDNQVTTSWHNLTLARVAGSATDLYINGSLDVGATQTTRSGNTQGALTFIIGKGITDLTASSWDGLIDEIRVSNIALSADWIATEHTNMATPGTFHTISTANESPTLANLETATLSYQETDPAQPITSSIECNDYSDVDLTGATIQITTNYVSPEDTLEFVDANGITGSWVEGTGTLTLTGTASLTTYNAALRSIKYYNNSLTPSTLTRTVSISIDDGVAISGGSTRNISINGVNNPPVLTSIEGTTLAFTDGDPDTAITSSVLVSDLDDAYMDSAWVSFTAGYVSGEDKLLFTPENGITASWNSVSGVILLSGSSSTLNYQTALRSVRYENLNPDPSVTTRTISFEISDGSDHSSIVTRDLSVTPVNDAPILGNVESIGLAYEAGDGAVAITDDLTAEDGDDTFLDSARVQITGSYVSGEDVLAFSSIYGITSTWYSGIGLLVLQGTNTLTQYEIALRSVTYENTQPSPQLATRVVEYSVSDGELYSPGVTRAIASGKPATVADLELWLNGNADVFNDLAGTIPATEGQTIALWKDQSGNGHDFINDDGNPLARIGVAGLNSANAIEFSGTGGESMVDEAGEAYINGLTGFTSFFVVQSYSTGTDKGFMTTRNADKGDKEFTIRYDATGDNGSASDVIKVAIGADVTSNEKESSQNAQTTDAQIICVDWNSGSVYDLYLNGVLNNPSFSGIPPNAPLVNARRFKIGVGAEDTPPGGWDGLMSEVIFYTRHLSEFERSIVEEYLSDKYSLSVGLLEPATGGEAISADDANSAWTTLTGPRLTEDVSGDLALNGTIILNAPIGFQWDTGGADPGVTVEPALTGPTSLAMTYTSRNSSTVTFTVTNESSAGVNTQGKVTFSGLRIQPNTGTVPNSGTITNTGTTGATGATNFGIFEMFAGTASNIIYSQAPTIGTLNNVLSPAIDTEVKDANGNSVLIAGTPIAIAITTGSGSLSGSMVLNTDAQGQVSFSDLSINTVDTYQLTASSAGLTSAVSGNFDITNPGQFTTFLLEKESGGPILTQDAGISFNVKISAVDGTQTVDATFNGTVDISSSGVLSVGSGTTVAFTAGVLSSYTLALSSIGDFTLTATNTGGSEFGNSNSFSVLSGAASAITSEIISASSVIRSDGASTTLITVQLKDAGGNDLNSGGETVNLIASAGSLLGVVVDEGDGTYTQTLQSSNTVETAVITGLLNGTGMTDDASVQFDSFTHKWESDPGNDPYTSNWNDALNWDNGIPGVGDAVLIPNPPAEGIRYPIISTDNLQIGSMSIESGADVTISGGISFDITGDLSGQGEIIGSSVDTLRVGGELSISSLSLDNVEFNGSLSQRLSNRSSLVNMTIDNPSGVLLVEDFTVTGTLTLTNGSLVVPTGRSLIANTKSITSGTIRGERGITGVTGWRLLASPVASTYADLFSNFLTQGYTGSDSATGSPSVLYYDETYTGTDNQRWRKPANATDATVAGRGLFVYAFGDIPGEAAYSDPLPTTLDVVGLEDEGTAGAFDFGVTYTAAADTGWNLVGNPFMATIDWDDVGWTKTNMDNVIYVWDHAANSGEGAYLTWNGTAGSLGSGLISPFQGFWVKANAAAPVLKVPKTSKVTGGVFYKRAQNQPLLNLLLENDTLLTNTFIEFNEFGSINKDDRDAYYLMPPTQTYLELYTESYDHKLLTIQSHPSRFGRTLEIPIYVNGYVNSAPLSGSYKLSWPRMQDLHSEWTLTLEDLETGAQIDMAVHEYYEFDVNRLGKKSLLPISPTRNLTGSVPFQLMKKSDEDGPRFLLRIDPGNAFPEIPKDFTLGQNYPNPFNEGTIIPFSIPLEGRVSAKIYDVRGRLVDQLVESKFYFAGQHNLNWLATGRSSGIYFCQMQIDDKYFTKKMILLR